MVEYKSGFDRLIHSRKFWITIVDVVLSTFLYFLTKYAAPEMVNDAKFIIGAWQPVILVLIGSIAYEDANSGPTISIVQSEEAEK